MQDLRKAAAMRALGGWTCQVATAVPVVLAVSIGTVRTVQFLRQLLERVGRHDGDG